MKKPKLTTRLITTGVLILAAGIAAGWVYQRYLAYPWTRDGQVSADIVLITPQVSGLVTEVKVMDNQFASKGDVLFVIDPREFEIQVQSSRIQVDLARQQVRALEAAVDAERAAVVVARTGITTARNQIEASRAEVTSAESLVAGAEAGLAAADATIAQRTAELSEATSERDRAVRLAEQGAGSVERAESKTAAAEASTATLDSAKANRLAAEASYGQAVAGLAQSAAYLVIAETRLGEAEAQLASALAELARAEANLGVAGEENVQIRSAKAALAAAELDLEWTTVRAPSDGYVTNLNVHVGNFATTGSPMLAFVDSTSFQVWGFFKETQLGHIQPGDRAVVTLMGYRDAPLEGVVDSVGWAISPPDTAEMSGPSGLVPVVQPSFDWIRLAQRVPVYVKLTSVPEGVQLTSGTTASVAIRPRK